MLWCFWCGRVGVCFESLNKAGDYRLHQASGSSILVANARRDRISVCCLSCVCTDSFSLVHREAMLITCTNVIVCTLIGGAVAVPVDIGDSTRHAQQWGAPYSAVQRTYRGATGMVSNPERGFRMEIDNGCDVGGITDEQVR